MRDIRVTYWILRALEVPDVSLSGSADKVAPTRLCRNLTPFYKAPPPVKRDHANFDIDGFRRQIDLSQPLMRRRPSKGEYNPAVKTACVSRIQIAQCRPYL